MQRLLLIVLLVAGLCDLARGDSVAPRAFTEQFARALQAAVPGSTVTVLRDLQIDVRRADRSSAFMSLENAYRGYAEDPKRFDQLVKVFAASIMTAPRGGATRAAPAKLDRTRIV